MNIKAIFTAIISLAIAGSAFAQDKIFQTNGNVIDAKIKMVSGDNIIYRHSNNPRGPQYSISVKEVDKVRYENGVEEYFSGTAGSSPSEERHSDERYYGNQYHDDLKLGSQVIAMSPFAFTENGLGFSFSYEKAIDPKGIIAFTLPFISTFNLNTASETDNGKHQDMMFYLSPGLKFYPTGSYGRIKYAVGPSLVLGAGEKTTGGERNTFDIYGTHYYFEPYQTHNKFLLGILVSNSLNFNPSEHLYMGMDLGFGFTYINLLGGTNNGITGMVQGGFKIGYRF